MGIIYKFTSSVSSKYYIGSKIECEVIDGKILDLYSGRYYYSSCKDKGFLDELYQGNLLLEILEVVSDKDNVLEREAYWQRHYDYKNSMCWNKVLATDLHPSMSSEKMSEVVNFYGETLNEYTVNCSRIVRLDAGAVRDGYNNNGGKMYSLLLEYSTVGNYKALDDKYNKKSYHKRYLKGCYLTDFDAEFDPVKFRELLRENVSFIKACEILNIKHYVVRYILGENFDDMLSSKNVMAEANGFLSRSELEKHVVVKFLQGEDRKSISKSLNGVSNSTVSRILDDAFRKLVKISDLD